jgi:prepilin-type N-terminal cleavage/methylation domain-containing protein
MSPVTTDPNCPRERSCGFTLIELLVAIAIVTLILALTAVAIQVARTTALRTQCSNNLRQIGLGLLSYHDSNGTFPPGVSYRNGADPFPFMSWNTRLLPFMDSQGLWIAAAEAFKQDPVFGTTLLT